MTYWLLHKYMYYFHEAYILYHCQATEKDLIKIGLIEALGEMVLSNCLLIISYATQFMYFQNNMCINFELTSLHFFRFRFQLVRGSNRNWEQLRAFHVNVNYPNSCKRAPVYYAYPMLCLWLQTVSNVNYANEFDISVAIQKLQKTPITLGD